MANTTREMSRRDVEEADRITREALGESVATEALRADGELALEEKSDKERIADLESELRRTTELVEHLALTPSQLGARAHEEQIARMHRARVAGMVERAIRDGRQLTVLIHPTGNTRENQPVPVSLNGHKVLIPRGVPTKVPPGHVMVLEEARIEQVVPIATPAGDIVHTPISMPSYPYTCMEMIEAA